MVELGHTIAVVNKSGKVVSTVRTSKAHVRDGRLTTAVQSKQLLNVFKEAKNAYRERKAEIIAERHGRHEEKQARKALEAMTIHDETRSHRSGHSHSRTHRSHHRGPELAIKPPPPPTERHHSHHSARSAASSRSSRSASTSPRHEHHHHSTRSMSVSPTRPSMAVARRHTTQDLALAHPSSRPKALRRSSTSAIDMDLAYGEFHPKSLQAYAPKHEEKDISGLVSKVKVLLDEADCAHASVNAIISHLQKNPEAMAAVALTLAEISNLASKMAPGALTALKGAAPGVFALLASPQFLIAAGVGVGITVVMLGGYKIIKKIKTKADLEKDSQSMDEMVEINPGVDLNRIENWRRGIADAEYGSVVSGTSVEGEFITPTAAKMKRARTMPMAMTSGSRTDDLRSRHSGKSSKDKERKSKSRKSGSTASGSTSGEKEKKPLIKAKKPSPLRMMFK